LLVHGVFPNHQIRRRERREGGACRGPQALPAPRRFGPDARRKRWLPVEVGYRGSGIAVRLQRL
jgi:hypothetical protein